jgi:hypothetical protein
MARVYHPSIKLVKRIVGNSDLPWQVNKTLQLPVFLRRSEPNMKFPLGRLVAV